MRLRALLPVAPLACAVALTGCGPSQLAWTASTDGCPDFDYDNPTEPVLTASQDGDLVVVEFGCVLQPADAQFTPDLSVDGKEVTITERWSTGEEADFPFLAQIELEDARGRLQIFWFRGDDEVAYDNVTLDVK